MRKRLTPNQLIAWNLREARREVGEREGLGRPLTQDEAAERLEPYLGVRWSRNTFSAVEEGTISGRRIRQLSGDDVVAFARAFDLPIGWFFFPAPESEFQDGYRVANEESSEELSPVELLDLSFSEAGTERLSQRLAKLGLPLGQLSKSQTQLADLGEGLLSAGLESHIKSLLTLADQLATAEQTIRALAEPSLPQREKSGAELITEALVNMPEYRPPTLPEHEGEIGERRKAHEIVETFREVANREKQQSLAERLATGFEGGTVVDRFVFMNALAEWVRLAESGEDIGSGEGPIEEEGKGTA